MACFNFYYNLLVSILNYSTSPHKDLFSYYNCFDCSNTWVIAFFLSELISSIFISWCLHNFLSLIHSANSLMLSYYNFLLTILRSASFAEPWCLFKLLLRGGRGKVTGWGVVYSSYCKMLMWVGYCTCCQGEDGLDFLRDYSSKKAGHCSFRDSSCT